MASGFSCLPAVDIDECATNNGGCQCSLLPNGIKNDNCTALCTNGEGYHECICPDGYVLDEDKLTCHGILKTCALECNIYMTLFVFTFF